MLVHRRVTPSINFAGTHLYTWVERGTVRVKCLAQEHNTRSPARARTRTARSGDERTNQEATAPPQIVSEGNKKIMFVQVFVDSILNCRNGFYCHKLNLAKTRFGEQRWRIGESARSITICLFFQPYHFSTFNSTSTSED